MKKWRITGILLAAGLFLVSCGAEEPDGMAAAGNSQASQAAADAPQAAKNNQAFSFPCVTVVSGKETFIPIEHINYTESITLDGEGKEQTISDYSGYLQPGDIAGVPMVPYQPGIAIRTEEEPLSCAYERFTLNGTSLGERTAADGLENIVLPEPEEDYLVELRVSFGEEGRSAGYQYFFRVTDQEPTPVLEITSGSGTEKTMIAAAKGAGAFPALTMEETVRYLPLGSRLELAFPEDIRLEEITVYDMVLTDSRENFLENTDGLGKGTKLQPEAPVLDLDENGKAMERGYPKNDRTGGVLRGFLFQCRFADGREEVYSAAVRTDAAFGAGTESFA